MKNFKKAELQNEIKFATYQIGFLSPKEVEILLKKNEEEWLAYSGEDAPKTKGKIIELLHDNNLYRAIEYWNKELNYDVSIGANVFFEGTENGDIKILIKGYLNDKNIKKYLELEDVDASVFIN